MRGSLVKMAFACCCLYDQRAAFIKLGLYDLRVTFKEP